MEVSRSSCLQRASPAGAAPRHLDPQQELWRVGVVGLWVLVVLNGCDAGEAPLTVGPRPRLLAYEPKHGQGLECGPAEPGCGFPVNRPLSFVLDRWLLPTTAARESIRVDFLGSEDFVVRWDPIYDVVTRTVRYMPEWNWDQGYLFELQLFDPSTKEDHSWGFRSYDGQLLEHSGIPEHILFRVGAIEERTSIEPKHTSCKDALAAFASAGCTASNCHRAVGNHATGVSRWVPRAGLALDDAPGLASAIGRVAHTTDRGGLTGSIATASARFGVNMALVEAGEPSLSFLVYRMLLGRNAYRDQVGTDLVRPPSTEELERACSWFGVTEEMPPRQVGWPSEVSPIDLVRTIQRWIGDGATTAACESIR